MKTSKEWLSSYIEDFEVSDREYIDKMTLSGSKVEGVERFDENLEKIVVAQIVEIKEHENANKLKVCMCDIGTEVLQIVTGASNVKVNDKVPLVLDGGRVATDHDGNLKEGGVKIKKGKLRGVESFGMLCSINELGLDKSLYPDASEDGIYILKEDAKVGEDICDYLSLRDSVFEYEITSNRIDCFGVLGLAREAAATFNKKFNMPSVSYKANNEDINTYLKVSVKDDLCKRYIAKIVKNVVIKESPKWLQSRLISSGIRPINNIVDITNYVMLEYGQPMHAFDYNLVEKSHIIVERANNETFITLDNVERKLDDSILMIKDEKKSIAIAGIMGGANSKVSEGVKTVIFESANFDGTNIRLSSKKLGIRTESSGKFEKDLDPNNAYLAIERAMQLVELLEAGEIVGGCIDIYKNPVTSKKINLDYERINRILGTNIEKDSMLKILKALEIDYLTETNELIIPTFRKDLECLADIAEEVARFYGYDNISTSLFSSKTTLGGRSRDKELERKAVDIAVKYGFSECLNYSFESKKVFDKLLLDENNEKRQAIEISNPLGEDFSIMRTVAVNGILNSLATNYNRRNSSVRLYELANVYIAKELPLKTLADERKKLSLAFFDDGDFFDLKGVVEDIIIELIGNRKLKYKKEIEISYLHPKKRATVFVDNVEVAYLGQLHPVVAENYKLSENTYLAVIDMKNLLSFEKEVIKYERIAKYPGITRDISLVVPKKVLSSQIEEIIENRAKSLLENCELFDIYEGANLKDGTKSLAYKINFRNKERTLEEKEIASIMEKIFKDLEKIEVYLRA